MRVLAATAAAAVLVIGIGLAAMPALHVVNGEVAERLATIRTASEDLSAPHRDGCHLGRKAVDQPDCLFGDSAGSRDAVLWGDSHAFHWFAGVNAAAEKTGWRLRSWSKSACPSAEIAFFHEERPYETCDRWREAMMAKLHRHSIQQWFADFIDALQESQLERGPLGPVAADAPTRWPLRSINNGARYHH